MRNEETTILTGFKELDELTGGFRKSELVVLGGCHSMGKTAFAVNIAKNIALEQKIPVLMFSPDLSKEEIENRIICAETGVEIDTLKNLQINNDEKQRIDECREKLNNSPLLISTECLITNIIKKAQDEKAANPNLGLIIVDYLSFIEETENCVYIGKTIKKLKFLALELKIPIFVTNYVFSRRVKERENKRPYVKDFAWWKNIHILADTILLLHRDEYYDCTNPYVKNKAEIRLAQHIDDKGLIDKSNNKRGIVNFLFKRETGKYKEIDISTCIFEQITSLNKTSFTAKYGDYWFEISTNGNILYKIKCQNLRRISENLLIAKINNKEGLIDNDFNAVAGFKHSDFKTLDKNFEYFKFRQNNKWGVTDRNGNILIEAKYDSIKRADKDFNYMFVTKGKEESLIDRNENIIDEEKTEQLICTPEFIENTWNDEKPDWRIVEIKGKYGLIDKEFNQLKIQIEKMNKVSEKFVKNL